MSFLYTLFLIFPLLIPPTTPTTPTTTREKHYPICDRKTTGEETKRETERRHRLSPRVDPFVGSGGDGYGVASLSPAAQVPFGMARVGPDSFGRLFSLPWKHIGFFFLIFFNFIFYFLFFIFYFFFQQNHPPNNTPQPKQTNKQKKKNIISQEKKKTSFSKTPPSTIQEDTVTATRQSKPFHTSDL